MYRNRLDRNGFYQPYTNRSTTHVQASRAKDAVRLIPEKYSDGICLYTLGPSQVYTYQYSMKKTSTKTYVCEILFYPKVVNKKHISAVVHYPARNNAKPHTYYKNILCFVPRCLDHYQTKKIVTEPRLEEIYKTVLYHQPPKRVREYSSSLHMVPKTFDTVRWILFFFFLIWFRPSTRLDLKLFLFYYKWEASAMFWKLLPVIPLMIYLRPQHSFLRRIQPQIATTRTEPKMVDIDQW